MDRNIKNAQKSCCLKCKSPLDQEMEILSDAGKVVLKCDVGFGNTLYIRGQGAGLSWSKGCALKNIGTSEWVFEPDHPFTDCEFKVLINDVQFEKGDNHRISYGDVIQYTPLF